ncbi:MAG: hypothetical protein U0361_15480 [Nitrospiraceae bacterium]
MRRSSRSSRRRRIDLLAAIVDGAVKKLQAQEIGDPKAVAALVKLFRDSS